MKKDVYKLTNPQKNIWELEQINKEGTKINHILAILKLKGNLKEDLLVKTMNKIIEKNDSFRLKFIKNGQEVTQYVAEYEYTPIGVKHQSTDDITEMLEEYQNLEITLDKPFSFYLVFTPNYTYVLYKTHHIIADAWSVTQTAEQVKEFYEKLLKEEPEEAFDKPTYISFIEREQTYLESNKYNIDEEFWKNYVQQIIPTKLFNNSNNFDKKSKRYINPIDENLFKKISNYCEENKITEYSFFLGILSIYFAKIYNLKNIVFGTPFLNRQKRLNELICTGMFISTLPISINIDIDTSFLELCKKIGTNNISLFKHSGYPFHRIQELYCEHTKETSALYEIGFSYQINKQENSMENNDFGECSWEFSGEQNNPLTIHLTTLNNDKVINYDYQISCFSESTIQKMNSTIMHIIDEVLNGKNNFFDIDLLTDEDIKGLITLNDTGSRTKNDQTVIEIFENIVKKYPQKIALTYDDINVTYEELNQKINTLSKTLINLGVTKNTPVALFFDKSIEMIVSMFAILKSGRMLCTNSSRWRWN